MKNLVFGSVLLLVIAIFSGCQGDERIREVANQELQEEIKVNSELSARDEKALAQLQRFYQGVAGTYVGTAQSKNGKQKIQITLLPSLPPTVTMDRVRTRDEIASDITNLTLGAQIIVWSADERVRNGCQLTGIKPDILDGKIEKIVESSDCASYIKIQIDEAALPTQLKLNDVVGVSRDLSRNLLNGRMDRIEILNGQMVPSTGEVLTFTVQRVAL